MRRTTHEADELSAWPDYPFQLGHIGALDDRTDAKRKTKKQPLGFRAPEKRKKRGRGTRKNL